MRWFRLYDDAINDPKILKLPESTRWHWVAVLCIASKNGGSLPSLEDISIQLRTTSAKATEIIALLVKAGLLDKSETGFTPHNWSGRQYKSDVSTERVKRFRNVSETSESVSVSDSVSVSSKKEREIKKCLDDWPDDFGDQFWKAYPRKTEKLAAMKKLAIVRKSGMVTFADLMKGVHRYAGTNPDPKYTKHPTTWLNAGCWSDEIGVRHEGTRNTGKTGYDALLAVAARKARALVGDGDMAGPADEGQFPFGSQPFGGRSEASDCPAGGSSASNERAKPGANGVYEGEIIAPDKNAAGIPDSGRIH